METTDINIRSLTPSGCPPDRTRLPPREEVARLFAVVRLPRFRTFLRLVYCSGLRLSEALALEVDSIKQNGTCLYRIANPANYP